MVVGRDTGEERIGADRLRRTFGEVADHDAVVIRPGRLEQQPAQQPVRRVGQLEQLEDRHDPEHVAEEREAAGRQGDRQQRVDQRHAAQLEDGDELGLVEQAEGDDNGDVGGGHGHRHPHEGVQPLGARDGEQPRKATGEDVDRQLERIAVHDPGQDGQCAGHHRARGALQEDADEQHGRRGRHHERQQRSVSRDAQRDGAHHQGEHEEEERPVAVPDGRLEAPQVADQQRRDDERHERVPDHRAELDAWACQAQGVEHLELLDGDRVAFVDDALTRLERDLVGRHLGTCLLLRLRRQLVVDLLGGRHQRRGEVAGELPLRVHEVGRDEVADGIAGLEQLVLANGVGEGRLQRDARRRGDGVPALDRHGRDGFALRERNRRRVGGEAADHLVGIERAGVAQLQDADDPARHGVEGEELILLVVGR